MIITFKPSLKFDIKIFKFLSIFAYYLILLISQFDKIQYFLIKI